MIEADVKRALHEIAWRDSRYELFLNYYEGRHRLAFATPKFRSAFGLLFRELSDNLCPAVVDALADRLQIEGFTNETGGQGDDTPADDLWELWESNRMERRAGEVHLEALRSGDAYVIVWPDARGFPRITPQAAETMACRYDPEDPGRLLWAAKVWAQDDGYVRLTMYYPDRIEKYITEQTVKGALPDSPKAFVPFAAAGEAWPLPNPYALVPVFHFANNAPIGRRGRSELADVIPLQDALNKALCDMIVASEFAALPQRWATGISAEYDDNGFPVPPFKPGLDSYWLVGNDAARFGQFDAADFSGLLAQQEAYRAEIARVSGTPAHYFTLQPSSFPSGEAMRTAEARFLGKARDRQSAFGDVWADVIMFCATLAGIARAERQVSTRWRDAAPRSELETMQALQIKVAIGISQQQAMREMGYSDDEIEQMLAEKQASAAQFGTSLLDQLAQGQDAGPAYQAQPPAQPPHGQQGPPAAPRQG